MDLTTLAPLITGSGGALVVLLAWIYAIGSKRMVPGYVFQSCEGRNGLLEEENSELNDAIIKLSKENAGMEARLDGMGHELEGLRTELKRLREDVRDAGA